MESQAYSVGQKFINDWNEIYTITKISKTFKTLTCEDSDGNKVKFQYYDSLGQYLKTTGEIRNLGRIINN